MAAGVTLSVIPSVGHEVFAAPSGQVVPTPTTPANPTPTRTPGVIVIPSATRTPTRPPLMVRDPLLPRDLTVVAATPRVIIFLPTATPTPHRHWPHYPPDGYYPTPTPTPMP